MTVATRSSRYEQSVASIVRLPPEKWIEAGKAAVEKERATSRKGSEKLAEQLSVAFEKAAARHEAIAAILRKDIDLDPASACVEFLLFRSFQIAKLFNQNPKKLAQIKIEAEHSSHNVSYKFLHEIFEEISGASEEIVAGGKVALELDDEGKMFGGCSLREIFAVMEWCVEKYNKKICDIYPEYTTIPKMVEEHEVDQNGRPVRKRQQKKIH